MLCKAHGHPHLHLSEVEDAGLRGVITISTSFQRAYGCEVKCCEHAMAIVASKELTAIKEEIVEEAPDPQVIDQVF